MRQEEFQLGAVTHLHMLATAHQHGLARLYDSVGSHLQRIGAPYPLAHAFHQSAYTHYTNEANLMDSAKPVGVKKYRGKEIYTRRPQNEDMN